MSNTKRNVPHGIKRNAAKYERGHYTLPCASWAGSHCEVWTPAAKRFAKRMTAKRRRREGKL